MKNKNIFLSFILAFIIATSGVMLPVAVSSAVVEVGNTDSFVCGFDSQKEGRTIVEFNAGTKKIHDDKDGELDGLERATMEVGASISAGTYDITLVSYDGYSSRITATPQLDERWFIILENGGTEVARTSAIDDLADNVSAVTLTQQVDNNFNIVSDVDSIVA